MIVYKFEIKNNRIIMIVERVCFKKKKKMVEIPIREENIKENRAERKKGEGKGKREKVEEKLKRE